MPGQRSESVRYWRDRALRAQADADQLARRCESLEEANASLRCELEEVRGERGRLQSEVARLRLENRDLRERITMIEHALQHADERWRLLANREFGSSSERLTLDQGYLAEVAEAINREWELSDEERAVLAGGAPPLHVLSDEEAPGGGEGGAQRRPERKRRRPPNAGGRKPLPENLERVAQTYQPPEDHPDFVPAVHVEQIGTTLVERLDCPEIRAFVAAITCPVYRMTAANGITWQQTVAPPGVVHRCQATDRFIIHSAVDKVADHLPGYRQEQRAAREGLPLPRAKLCRWHIELATFVECVADALLAELLTESVVGIDDSVHRLLESGRGRCRQGRIWAVCGQAGVAYQITETREGRWIEELLEDFSGAVMGDGYRGHLRLLARSDIIALFCWAHVRRKFFEAADRERRDIMLALIAVLYQIEADIAELPPDQRSQDRRRRAKPQLDRIKRQLDAWEADPRVLPKSGIGKATRYTLNLWDGLERYLDIGEAPIDNNATERHMRPAAMQRKSSLFSASTAGAHAYGVLLSLIASARQHDLDPVAYLVYVVEQLHHCRAEPSELTPRQYAERAQVVGKAAS